MKKVTLFLVIFLFFITFYGYTFQIDRIVATVADEAVTLTDLKFEYMLLNPDKEFPSSIATLEIRTLLEQIIQRKLVLKDAVRLALVEASDSDVENEFASFRKNFKTYEKYKSFLMKSGFSDNYVRERVKEKLIISSFLEKRVAILAFVKSDEVENYYRENFDSYKGRSLSEVSDEIREKLFSIKFQSKLEEYIQELRQRYKVVILPDEGE